MRCSGWRDSSKLNPDQLSWTFLDGFTLAGGMFETASAEPRGRLTERFGLGGFHCRLIVGQQMWTMRRLLS